MKFIKVPNYIIEKSLTQNKKILPLYLYSIINSDPYHYVNTNLALISELFNNSRAVPEFKSALSSLEIETSSITQVPINITKTSHLNYKVIDRTKTTINSWTKVEYDEYYYFLLTARTSPKFNIIELMNVFIYLKQKISSRHNYELQNGHGGLIPHSQIPISKISKDTNLSKNTVTKYLTQLEQLDLIEIRHGDYDSPINKEINDYILSNKWRDKLNSYA